MPTPEDIVAGLREIANDWKTLAIGWHVYFAWMLLLGATGLVYGLIGAMVLNVAIDGVLASGALAIIAVGLRPNARQRRPDITTIEHAIQDDAAKTRFSGGLVQELSEPARRYLLHSIQAGTPLARSVQLTMSGRMRPRGGAKLIDLTAVETLASPKGFLWTAHLRIGPIPIRVRDHYIDDDGAVAVTALGIIPIGRQSGPEVARSSRHRLAGEAVWLPSALVPGPGVTWEAVDSAHARVTITVDGEEVPLTLKIDEQGRLRELLMERYGNVGVQEWQLIPYGFAIEEERTFDGFTIPSRIRGGWWYGTDRYDPEGATFLQIDSAKYL